MSYPPQNPYGPPPGQQPQYGYPQQQPQQPSPYGPYPGGGGMPGMQPQYPVAMPGGVKTARVLLFVLSGVNLIGLVLSVMLLGGVSRPRTMSRRTPPLTTSPRSTSARAC